MFRIALILAFAVLAIVVIMRLVSRDSMPPVGAEAPDFSLPSQEGLPVNLRQYRGQWIVLYFYPKDQTSGCTREAHNFSLDQPQYAQRNTVVLGVSLDSVDSHKRFCTKEALNFKLLADTQGKTTQSYGSLTNLGIVKFAARHTFIVDPAGKIAKVYGSVNPTKHSAEVLAALDQLQGQKAQLSQ
jgi:peroxiredoxin Q/BCP